MKIRKVKVQNLGLFPLSLVILPKESTRLHIYQSQFKSLVNDCFASGKDFVILNMINGKPSKYGTCVKLIDVERFYPDGKMDIKVEGFAMVKVSNINENKNVPYSVGEVEKIESALPEVYTDELKKLFSTYCDFNGIEASKSADDATLFDIAQHLKLSKEVKSQILRNAGNTLMHSKIMLNELRLLVLANKLQDQAGFRFYMN